MRKLLPLIAAAAIVVSFGTAQAYDDPPANAAAGAAVGAGVGFAVGGPVGAAIGAGVGGTVGAGVGEERRRERDTVIIERRAPRTIESCVRDSYGNMVCERR